MKWIRRMVLVVGLLALQAEANPSIAAPPAAVKVASVHFAPTFGRPDLNRTRLVELTQRAAENGAKIVVHTEMATAGYAFFSRADIASVAEPRDGPTARAVGAVAKAFGIYVVFGVPEVDPPTGRYFNAAVLIGPDGQPGAVYRKRSMLLEAAYNAEVTDPIPVFDTPYGRVGIAICADLFYSQIPRLAAVDGARLLLVPANVGVDLEFLKVRATENNMALVVANRFGAEGQGTKPVSFSQDRFAIPSPFPYDFSFGSQSAIIAANGDVLAEHGDPSEAIIYATVPIVDDHVFPVVRRPDLYALLAQDTLEPYTVTQMKLPATAKFAATAVVADRAHASVAGIRELMDLIIQQDSGAGQIRLAVFPENLLDMPTSGDLTALSDTALALKTDLVVSFARTADGNRKPTTVLFSGDPAAPGQWTYARTHRLRNESLTPAKDLIVVDRPYGRVSLAQAEDLIAPEVSGVLAKMGVDVVAVAADGDDKQLWPYLRSRSGDYIHIVSANRSGGAGIFLGGYQATPSEKVDPQHVTMSIDTAHVRNKKEPRFLDVTPLLQACTLHTC